MTPSPETTTVASTTEDPTPKKSANKRPCWSKTIGRVSVSVFKHDQPKGSRFTISISRSYLKDGTWVRSSFLDLGDLPSVHEACNEAKAFIGSVMGGNDSYDVPA